MAKHTYGQNCKDRYGNGTAACPGCKEQAEAQAIKCAEVGCRTNPYDNYCGHAMSPNPPCKCGRMQNTD